MKKIMELIDDKMYSIKAASLYGHVDYDFEAKAIKQAIAHEFIAIRTNMETEVVKLEKQRDEPRVLPEIEHEKYDVFMRGQIEGLKTAIAILNATMKTQ